MITSLSGQSLNDRTALEYVALSYVWGDPILSDLIECNSYQMHITYNLSLALRTIRKLNYHLVWIDQICINEQDFRKRASQVALMTKIYSNASKVLVYLGEESDWSRSALEYADTVEDQIAVDQRLEREAHTLDWRSYPDYHFDREVWMRWLRLYEYHWFSRVWVIQETLLASHLGFAVGLRTLPR